MGITNDLLILKSTGNHNVGFLSFFESQRDVPFEIKRVYYIYDVPAGTKRGMHAHRKLRQFLWCPYGAIKLVLDNGIEKKSTFLILLKRGYM